MVNTIEKDKIAKLKSIIVESDNIVFFGGAGVSTESNIPDFRSSNGLFNKSLNKHFTPEQLVSRTYFERYPDDFFDFYKKNLIFKDARPNLAHHALAKLEKLGKLKAVITQNIDGLHQLAGSKNVFELHGSVHSNTCTFCKSKYSLEEFLALEGTTPKCSVCGNTVKPDVVLYEESLDDRVIAESIKKISQADVLIVGGTSLVVYPAAGFLNYFKGSELVLINKSSTNMDSMASLIINDSIGKILSEIVNEL
ncbi:NAD-dependent protein deacylase [Peptostreptococcus porci]|uniref:NAD-dependent protein deacylase n=1 Tax=Peptostreptococcus porci TaxID=2652282 RepID=UPI0023F02607|nr:NAD-dependent protein deacylase [Peptostreptococcus porci]MDD7182342.1 NAD-dependent protein deacylase [Peptostreptococcus porci]MDY5964317.1 NAD-dependent protein deacylase [Peptostreptococcus porci]